MSRNLFYFYCPTRTSHSTVATIRVPDVSRSQAQIHGNGTDHQKSATEQKYQNDPDQKWFHFNPPPLASTPTLRALHAPPLTSRNVQMAWGKDRGSPQS